MSVKKCIAAKCPFLKISMSNADDKRGRFICKTDEYSQKRDVLISEIEYAGKQYNAIRKGHIEPCSVWENVEECSNEEYKKAVRILWALEKETIMQP
jgi:hypothetical protein